MNHNILGFNGERNDPANDVTHLGNGYRAYNPVLFRFTFPDSMSPFGEGGINPYVYCAGDPVNRSDPSGHHSLWGWLGIATSVALGILLTPVSGGSSLAAALSVFSVSTAVISASLAVAQQFVEESDPKMAAILGWSALGTGILSGLSSAVQYQAVPGAKSLEGMLKGVINKSSGRLQTEAFVHSPDTVTALPKNTVNMIENRFTKLFRVDMQPPIKILKDGFTESRDFRGVPKMIPEHEKALIVAENVEGARRYQSGPLNGKGYLYEINHPGIRGASLTRNIDLNAEAFDNFLASGGRTDPNRLAMAGRLSEEFKEAHIYLDEVKPEHISLIKNPHRWLWW